jgi:hypothetical protein
MAQIQQRNYKGESAKQQPRGLLGCTLAFGCDT